MPGPTTALPRRAARSRHHSPQSAQANPLDAGVVEEVQRARIALDVAATDLDAAESRLGVFHETTRYFREAKAIFQRDWDRLRAIHGTPNVHAALAASSEVIVLLERPNRGPLRLIVIQGATYAAEPIEGTALAPILWRITRLPPTADHGSYYLARLNDATTRCDCAEWHYDVAELFEAPPCKHLARLADLGWLGKIRPNSEAPAPRFSS